MNFRRSQAFVGTSAFAHKGGMHTHAVAKNPASYEHIDPALVGNERRILVSELSGQSTILAKTQKYQIAHDKAMMGKILNQVQDLENAGYEFEAAEASFDIIVKKAVGTYKPVVRAEELTASTSNRRATGEADHRGDGQAERRRLSSSTPSARATAR